MAWRRSPSRDDGSVSVEAAILLPLLILLFLTTVQLGTFFYARAVASTAARQGLDSARVANGSEGAGSSASEQFLSQVTAGMRNTTVDVARGPEDTSVTVSADVMSLVPFWAPRVTVTVTAPTERVVE